MTTPDEVKRLATSACAAHAAVRNTTSNADRETLDKACALLKQVHLEIDALAAQAVPAVPEGWQLERAVDMLTAYAELIKATGRYAEEHYIPEVEHLVGELRNAMLAASPQAAQPVAWMWQHPETGHTGFVENCTDEDRQQWERVNRPRVFICPLYASPQADTQPKEKPE